MPASSPSVFLVDDDQDIRSALSRALSKRGFEVQAFESASRFLEEYDGSQAGCLILDYGMPDMTGLELQQHLNSRGYSIPTIFITGHGGVPESVQAMRGGALDFLEKPFRQEVLIERINLAMKTAEKVQDKNDRLKLTRASFDSLTAREKEIASLMVANPSSTSSKELGRQLGISPRTIDHHRARILEKMDISSVAELIEMSYSAELFKDKK